MATCQINEIFVGEVASIQNYGAFVRIPGCSQQGLVHRSQVSSSHVEDVADILQRGDKIWCKVISTDNGKIALSMKLVNQGNGKDLDPNGIQLHLDQQKRKQFDSRPQKQVIVLDAVYKTICSKCKTPGHLAKDCFSIPDGKRYELIPEIDDEVQEPMISAEPKSEKKEKKHKSRKSKKRKRSKSSKRDESDDDESISSSEKNKKKSKKSKEQKRKKKHKHKDSSSDNESSRSSVSSYENRKRSKKCKHSKAKHSD